MAERPDRVGRTLLLGVLVWSATGLVVLGAFELAFPHRIHAIAPVASSCAPSVSMGAVDAHDDLALPIVTRTAPCGTATDGVALLHAYLEGAELDSTPGQPRPKPDSPRGAGLYQQHCASCHGATGDGIGVNACALDTPAAVHKRGVFALRTTEHEALPTDEDLFRTITRGVHGTAMPPWILLPELDRWALVDFVKSLSTQFTEDTAPPPSDLGPMPAATSERTAHGRALFKTAGCASCHGEQGHGDGVAAPSLAVPPRDFTRGRFHRGSSVIDIDTTLVTGLDGTPMGSFAKVLTADEMWDLALFVHDLSPPMTDRPGVRCPTVPMATNGQELFGIRNVMKTTSAPHR